MPFALMWHLTLSAILQLRIPAGMVVMLLYAKMSCVMSLRALPPSSPGSKAIEAGSGLTPGLDHTCLYL